MNNQEEKINMAMLNGYLFRFIFRDDKTDIERFAVCADWLEAIQIGFEYLTAFKGCFLKSIDIFTQSSVIGVLRHGRIGFNKELDKPIE